ncbi:MAG: ABC transporter substrate-binding protein [Deltaproteobacteria bacterium]|nr:ABC transporter substrate-binding protein [Deltaproteobacteria bacterium]
MKTASERGGPGASGSRRSAALLAAAAPALALLVALPFVLSPSVSAGAQDGAAGTGARSEAGTSSSPVASAGAAMPGAASSAAAQQAVSGEASKPLRIISLFAAHTEIVLREGGRDSLVGISEQETYDGPETDGWDRPPAFSIHDDVEKFLAFKPDLILVRPQHLNAAPNLFETLEGTGIRIWSRQITEAEGLFGYWQELGSLIGRQAEAERMTEGFKAALVPFEANLNRPGRPGVFLESIHREIKTFTPDSIPVWILGYAGGRNVASDAEPSRAGYIVANYGPERLLSKASEVDVYLSQEGPMNRVPLSEITGRDIFRTLPAVKNGRVFKVPENLMSRPTPSLLDGRRYLEGCIRDGKPPADLALPD